MKKYCLIFLVLALTGNIYAQDLRKYQKIVTQERQRDILSYVADDMTEGRESGGRGNDIVRNYIVRTFRNLGLKPVNWSYTQSFCYTDTVAVRNVLGCLPASVPSDEYIVVGAHYDHLGKLHGRVYNGADDNASGVTALISLAEMFSAMKKDGAGPRKNIIFVAFDGKELDMCGSEYFVKHLAGLPGKMVCAVNMDILGTSLVPTGDDRNYMMAIGEETLPEKYRGHLRYAGRWNYKMDLTLSFYGSGEFTKLIYRTGDQQNFAEAGIPAVLFTSGFHQHTYKPTDKIDIIDFEILKNRTDVIFDFINYLCGY